MTWRGAAASLLAVVLLSGCGGEPSVEDYCEQLGAERERLAELVGSGDPGSLLGENLPLLEELGEQAPRDLVGEWDTLLTALRQLDAALGEAGLEVDDFEDGQAPDGAAPEDLEPIAQAVRRLQSADVVAAASGIETQARDVCKINIGL